MSDNRPIGVFDTGLGGLTAMRALAGMLPHEDIVYFGDTARVPYGTRSRDIIFKYLRQDIAFLRSFNIKALVIACGTASTAGLPALHSEYDFPLIGVVQPAAQAAARATKSGRVGLIATAAAVRSGAYEEALQQYRDDVAVSKQACPLLVPLVENGRGRLGDIVAETIVAEYLAPLRADGVDTLVLGCTHYPLLADIIAAQMGPAVTLIDAGEEVARETAHYLTQQGMFSSCETMGARRYFVSDSQDDFARNAALFLGHPLDGPLQKMDIDVYA